MRFLRHERPFKLLNEAEVMVFRVKAVLRLGIDPREIETGLWDWVICQAKCRQSGQRFVVLSGHYHVFLFFLALLISNARELIVGNCDCSFQMGFSVKFRVDFLWRENLFRESFLRAEILLKVLFYMLNSRAHWVCCHFILIRDHWIFQLVKNSFQLGSRLESHP